MKFLQATLLTCSKYCSSLYNHTVYQNCGFLQNILELLILNVFFFVAFMYWSCYNIIQCALTDCSSSHAWISQLQVLSKIQCNEPKSHVLSLWHCLQCYVLIFQNDAESYHRKINLSGIKAPTEKSTSDLPELEILMPEVESVSFHRYGKDLAITVSGKNMWFSNKVEVCSLSQPIAAKDSRPKSLQFNRNEKDVVDCIKTNSDYVKVELYSHFSEKVMSTKVPVEHKVLFILF